MQGPSTDTLKCVLRTFGGAIPDTDQPGRSEFAEKMTAMLHGSYGGIVAPPRLGEKAVYEQLIKATKEHLTALALWVQTSPPSHAKTTRGDIAKYIVARMYPAGQYAAELGDKVHAGPT